MYVDARYDAAIERASESADTFRAANDVVEAGRTRLDVGGLGAEQAKTDKARQDAHDANRNGWRTEANYAKSESK